MLIDTVGVVVVVICDLQTSGLLAGTYDEDESAASFQEALRQWRQSDTTKATKQSACLYCIILLLCFCYSIAVDLRYSITQEDIS